MDEFGSGYSSLNMISNLPIDVLKLDMMFIRNVFSENGNIRILKVIIDIADILSVPMIAEGVETEEQLNTLREIPETGDLERGFEIAHALKGVTANLSLTPLFIPINEITELLRNRTEADYRPAVGSIIAKRDELLALSL